jgi:hypothetical protein
MDVIKIIAHSPPVCLEKEQQSWMNPHKDFALR